MTDQRQKALFHIGLERTGTTSFQQFCTCNAGRFLDAGVLYPTKSLVFSYINHSPLIASYLPLDSPNDFYLNSCTASHARMLMSLRKEIDASNATTILISSEHLSSRFRAPQIAALAEDFRGYDCKIIISLRDHFTRFLSSYSSHIMSGAEQTLDDYVDMVLSPGNIYIRYADTIAMWERVFGRDNIIFFDYPYKSDVIEVILAKIGLAHLKTDRHKTYAVNPGLNATATEALRLINVAARAGQGTRHKDPYLVFRRLQIIRAIMAHELRAVASEPGEWDLNAQLQARLTEAIKTDQQQLASIYGITLSRAPEPKLVASQADASPVKASGLLAKTLIRISFDRWSVLRVKMLVRLLGFCLLDSPRKIKLHLFISGGVNSFDKIV